ncbi:MAG TPA: isochorismatase [Candidatus Binatia bacterium]|nr:isochorismatase [Candidatus Binatia bacterium]
MTATVTQLPLPAHYDPAKVVDDERWLDYGGLATAATDWRQTHGLSASATDRTKVGLLVIDAQNTFANPKGELFVGGRSGNGAVEDSARTAEFIYRNLGLLSDIHCTLDTHRAYAVFHPPFLVDEFGANPAPYTLVSHQDILDGKWTASPFMASALHVSLSAAQQHLEHYTQQLAAAGRYALTIWPFHAMLGGKGHALVSGLEEACFFHAIARGAQTGFEVKGTNAFTENYSVLGPEVLTTAGNRQLPSAQRNTVFIEMLLKFDVLAIAGQAKSHCVAWTIDDLLSDITAKDPNLAGKVYLLEDCTSPVVIPGVLDYTDEADAAFDRFRNAGMHVVKSTDPLPSWPDVRL